MKTDLRQKKFLEESFGQFETTLCTSRLAPQLQSQEEMQFGRFWTLKIEIVEMRRISNRTNRLSKSSNVGNYLSLFLT